MCFQLGLNKFQRVSNDLFANIGYSYNLSSKEQKILKWWLGQGGILWIEEEFTPHAMTHLSETERLTSKQINSKNHSKKQKYELF